MKKNHSVPSGPMYRTIYEDIRGKILEGQLSDGEIIPSENVLAKENLVSRVTVRSAINALKKDGLIDTVPGVGHRVSAQVIRFIDSMNIYFVGRRDNVTPIIFEAVQKSAKDMGADCRMMTYSNRFDSPTIEFDQDFLDGLKGASGIVLFNDKAPCKNLLSMLKQERIPMVSVAYPAGSFFDSVLSDNYNSAKTLVEELHSMGHKKTLYVSDEYLENNIESFRLRHGACEDTCKKLGAHFVSVKVLYNSPQYEENRVAMGRIADMIRSREASCVIASNSQAAQRLRTVLEREGMTSPRDYSLATFISDDNYFRENGVLKKIGGMEENWHAIGTLACETLISRIRNRNAVQKTILLPMTFAEGNTTSKLKEPTI